ncbi:ThiF family adenylyltransferase [Roseomonas sp. 18066]|uniref:ThiF family adenylyltransferase n=1 Tax=Roseomonas sp. 18066 TaxID=2681412 RepID=UPI00135CA2B8|nr:ThiF family adenylyltransferase [Roseomonas sp. 18066]
MALHPKLEILGAAVAPRQLQHPRAAAMAAYLASGDHDDARLLECRLRREDGLETVLFEVRAERPQVMVADIRRWEPVAAVFAASDDRQPCLFAAREDFPEVPHQNIVPAGWMRSPCVDDRPWAEARSTWTPLAFLERVRWWMGAAASGGLSDQAQAIDPLFVSSGPNIAIPRAFLQPDTPAGNMTLFAGAGTEKTALYHLRPDAARDGGRGALRLIPVRLPPQPMRAVRSAPRTLAELITAFSDCGFDLLAALREAALDVLNPPYSNPPRVAVLLVAPIVRIADGPVAAEDARAFGIPLTLGELGERLGTIASNPGYSAADPGKSSPYGRSFPPAAPEGLEAVVIDSLPVHAEFDRELARECAGLDGADARQVVLVGAGAVGSHLALALAREGRFRWTVVDDDHLLPHNLARHTLGRYELGDRKANALAAEVAELLGEVDDAHGLACNVLFPGDMAPELDAALAEAELVIDASASVAAARRLSDAAGGARRASVFLNPAGTASVVMSEDAVRATRLDALEGQYYRHLLREPRLRAHLAPPDGGLRYTGACRHVSSRIPETNVAALTALASRGFTASLDGDVGGIGIWTLDADGGVFVSKAMARTTWRVPVADWTVVYDEGLLDHLKAAREAALPAETGGALVGIVDVARKSIIVVDALAPPPDSVGSPTQFERGVDGLLGRLADIQSVTRDQVRYVGEWHSHPRRHSAMPSQTDVAQLLGLHGELGREGIPPVMLIAGERDVALVSATSPADAAPEASDICIQEPAQ